MTVIYLQSKFTVMKLFYGFISSFICFALLSFTKPVNPCNTAPADLLAIANHADIAKADSITSGAVKLAETSSGQVIAVNRELTADEINDVQQFIPVKLMDKDGTIPGTATEIIKYILSLLGGLLTSIILYFLHKRWPDIFTSAKLRDYKKNDNDQA